MKVDGNGRDEHGSKTELDGRDEVDNGKVNGSEVGNNEIAKEKHHQKTRKTFKSKKMIRFSDFFTFGARLAIIKIRQVFIKASIFHHFDSECHIWIETDALGYATGRTLSQLILDNLG